MIFEQLAEKEIPSYGIWQFIIINTKAHH